MTIVRRLGNADGAACGCRTFWGVWTEPDDDSAGGFVLAEESADAACGDIAGELRVRKVPPLYDLGDSLRFLCEFDTLIYVFAECAECRAQGLAAGNPDGGEWPSFTCGGVTTAKQGLIRGVIRGRRTALPSPSANLAGERWSGRSRDHPEDRETNPFAEPGGIGKGSGAFCGNGVRGKGVQCKCWLATVNVRAN